jgi:tetratricopeptide (TPR) repeat protein
LKQRGRLYAGLASTWLLLGLLLWSIGGRSGSVGTGHGITPWAYAGAQCGWVLHYLRLCFWPSPLVFDYGNRVPALGLGTLWPALGIALLAAAGLAAFLWQPRLGFLGVFLAALLAPTSSFVPIATQVAAEHRMYLAMAAVITLAVLAVWFFWRWITSRMAENSFLRRAALPLLLVGVACLFVWQTRLRNLDYRTELSLWTDTVRKVPHNPRAWFNLATARFNGGDAPGALLALNQAIELDPNDPAAWCNRGQVLRKLGRYEQAIADCNRSLALRPEQARALLERGQAFHQLKRYSEAITDYTASLQCDASQATAWFYRGNTYRALGRLQEAMEDYTRAIELEPVFPEAYANRGTVHGQLCQYEQAIGDCTRALAQRPGWAMVHGNRALFHYRSQQYHKAWEDVQSALRKGGIVDPSLVGKIKEAMRGRSALP